MESTDDGLELFKIYKRPKDDNEPVPKTECKQSFNDCPSSQRIKGILLKYQQINESNAKSTGNILDVIFNDQYSAVDILNDFEYIIQRHSVDDDPSQFDQFHDFMVKTDPAIICDVNDCQMVRRHFSRRRDDIQQGMDRDDYRLDILRQIHSYFIHSMDTTKLNRIERAQIEEEMKSIDDDRDEDYDDNDDDVQREEKRMELVSERMRQKTLGMDAVFGDTKSNRFCASDDLRGDDDQTQMNMDTDPQLQEDGGVLKTEPKANEAEDDDLAATMPKDLVATEEPLNSTIDDIPRSSQQRRLTMIHRALSPILETEDEPTILKSFCDVTGCEPENGVMFLKVSDWNQVVALNRFYELSGDASKLESVTVDAEQQQKSGDDSVYTEGLRFWYWNRDQKPKSAVQVNRRHDNLKEEMLATDEIGVKIWNRLVNECQDRMMTNLVKKMTANGIGADIYGITAGEQFAIRFLLALKLYTDFDRLNHIFCEQFRLKKLTESVMESLHSAAVRNGKFWNLSKLLTECVQCFGHLLMRKKTRYYRGINKPFIFPRFVARFYAPLSTSKSVCSHPISRLSIT